MVPISVDLIQSHFSYIYAGDGWTFSLSLSLTLGEMHDWKTRKKQLEATKQSLVCMLDGVTFIETCMHAAAADRAAASSRSFRGRHAC